MSVCRDIWHQINNVHDFYSPAFSCELSTFLLPGFNFTEEARRMPQIQSAWITGGVNSASLTGDEVAVIKDAEEPDS